MRKIEGYKEKLRKYKEHFSSIQKEVGTQVPKEFKGYKEYFEKIKKEFSSPQEMEDFIIRVKEDRIKLARVKEEVSKLVIGQHRIINSLLRAIIANGHVLLEGVPGIGKTLLVRTLAKVTNCSFGRIQFTPDLLPTDIIGITVYQEDRGFYTIKGPIFNNFVLADEINRAPPKVQSALLESMQERQATISKKTYPLPKPFFTLATQNPIESVGVYTLPEAQVDRFLFKLNVGYPDFYTEKRILKTNITTSKFEEYDLKQVITGEEILQLQRDVKLIYMDTKLEDYVVSLVDATRNPKKYGIKLGKYIEWPASPRASISIYIGSKAEALMNGSLFVLPQHIKTVAPDALRHRIIINFEGQAEGITADEVISEMLEKVPIP